jgi:hypothetical protein
VAFFARTKIGASFLISSSGAEDSELVSESESMVKMDAKWMV